MEIYTDLHSYHLTEDPESDSGSTPSFHHCIATLSGHTSYTSSLTLANNKTLYSGSSDGEIRSWEEILQYESDGPNPSTNAVAQGKGAVKSMITLHDKLFTAHQDHRIRVYRTTGAHRLERLATLPTLSDRAIKLLNPSNRVEVRRHKKSTWVNHVDAVSGLALAGDQSVMYSVSWDRTIKIWRVADFKCLESVNRAHDDAINSVVVSMEGDVYTGSADSSIKVWRKLPPENRHVLVCALEKHKSGVNALVISENGEFLYSGGSDRLVIKWEIKGIGDEIRALAVLRGHTKPVLCLAVASDLVVSGSADNSIRVWRGFGGDNFSCLAVLEGHQGPVKCLVMAVNPYVSDDSSDSASNYLVYSGSLDCYVKVWQLYV